MKEDDKRVMQEDYLNAQSQKNLLLKISWVLTSHNAFYSIFSNQQLLDGTCYYVESFVLGIVQSTILVWSLPYELYFVYLYQKLKMNRGNFKFLLLYCIVQLRRYLSLQLFLFIIYLQVSQLNQFVVLSVFKIQNVQEQFTIFVALLHSVSTKGFSAFSSSFLFMEYQKFLRMPVA